MMGSLPSCRTPKTKGSPELHYLVHEPRHATEPKHVLVLSHALGCDLSMWKVLADTLAHDCRVITYDHRGHGQSEVLPGAYSMQDLADDAARLIQHTQSAPVVWIGISMGGMVGQELALRYPSLVSALIIANSTSRYPQEAQTNWQQRIITLEQQGIPGVVEATLQRFFSPAFHKRDPATVDMFRRRLLSTDLRGYLGCCHAVRSVDTHDRLPQLKIPVQVIAGEQDQGTPPAMAKAMAEQIPQSRMTVLPNTAHLSVIEQPHAFTEIVRSFLSGL